MPSEQTSAFDLFRDLAEAVLVADSARSILYVNPAFERSTGFAAGELLGQPTTRVFETSVRNAAGGGATVSRKDGSSFHTSISARRADLAALTGGVTLYVLHTPAPEMPYKGMFRSVPAPILIVDPDGLITDATDRFFAAFGYQRERLIGTDPGAILSAPNERSRDTDLAHAWVSASENGACRLRRGDGAVVDVEISTIRRENGLTLVSLNDVSERNRARAELQRRNRELEDLNESLQAFTSIASHDMQEPLRKIRTFTDMLQTALAEDNREDAEHAVAVLSNAAQRASRLVGDLLAFSRSSNETLKRAPLQLDALIAAIVADLGGEEAAAEAEFVLDLPPLQVHGDETAVTQLFRNLIGNALKYRVAGRAPVVRIFGSRPAGRGAPATVSVADNGIGFEPEFGDSILQPFRRLHRRDEYPGSGIGLAICDTVARRHGWKLHADGRPNAGATFTLTIPDVIVAD